VVRGWAGAGKGRGERLVERWQETAGARTGEDWWKGDKGNGMSNAAVGRGKPDADNWWICDRARADLAGGRARDRRR
jgi:hypothetical protein